MVEVHRWNINQLNNSDGMGKIEYCIIGLDQAHVSIQAKIFFYSYHIMPYIAKKLVISSFRISLFCLFVSTNKKVMDV